MKIFVALKTTNEPSGGGNQFIRALKKEFGERDALSSVPSLADVILFNSHHHPEDIMLLKEHFPEKIFIHRVDGPMRLYNKPSDQRDDIVYFLNDKIADGTVFQSNYSRDRNFEAGISKEKPNTVIVNAVPHDVFYRPKTFRDRSATKIRLISTSFSTNVRKGFKAYKFLDENLDFDKFEYTFLGNSPVEFDNIQMKGCLKTEELASQLREHDVFITASENDPCSNSLIEALSCGLPVVALDSGGHPELVLSGGTLYKEKQNLLAKIEETCYNIEEYRENIITKNIDAAANEYLSFFKEVI